MNSLQQQYEDTLQAVRNQFQRARDLARLEWYQEVKKLQLYEKLR